MRDVTVAAPFVSTGKNTNFFLIIVICFGYNGMECRRGRNGACHLMKGD